MGADRIITPCLWFEREALEAAQFYTSIFPDGSIDSVVHSKADTPGPKAGDVVLVEFSIGGLKYQALNGGPHERFNDSVSMSVSCKDQGEVDRFSQMLTADGGKLVQCGWLKDKYGLAWQIVPKRLTELMSDPDPVKSMRVMQAMLQMVKIDIAGLEKAYAGH